MKIWAGSILALMMLQFTACGVRPQSAAPKKIACEDAGSLGFIASWGCKTQRERRGLARLMLSNNSMFRPTPLRVLTRYHNDEWPVSVRDKHRGISGTIDYSHASVHPGNREQGELDLPIIDSAGHRHELVWELSGEFSDYVDVMDGTYATRPRYVLWRLPRAVRSALPHLRQVNAVRNLPPEIARGDFTFQAGPRRPVVWKLAEPGARWQATDNVITPHLPRRRLVFSACSPHVCIVHYEHGGYGKDWHILALVKEHAGYTAVWHAVGYTPLRDLAALKKLLAGPPSEGYGYVAASDASI